MSEEIYLTTLFVIAGAFVLIFAIRYLSLRQDARAKTSKEEAYRDLSAKAVAVQGDAAQHLAGLQSELSGVAMRLTSIEKLLQDVG